ncbi:MAG: FmdB family zinc ribbon protein [Candidatus Eisenbacteria bacterium]
MPTYDYKCTKCGYTFSAEQSMLDKPLARCRKCRGKLAKLLPQSISLIFKGSGFYATDYKKSSGGAKGSRERRKPMEEGKKGSGKDTAETKTDRTDKTDKTDKKET